MQLELTPEERDLLKRVIDQAAKEMKVEVRRTSTRDYHDELQKEEKMLFDLVKRLGEAG
jgi:ribosome recycling factor